MPKRNPIPVGTRFSRLIVIGPAEPKFTPKGIRLYCVMVQCDCGTIKRCDERFLRNGEAVSCGCFNRELLQSARTKHGYGSRSDRSSTYHSWDSMIQRCTNPNNQAFSYYGARGITVCERWKSFVNFLADMGEKPPGLTLERKDNAKGYEMDNCKWASRADQMRNTRRTRIVTVAGVTGCIADLIKHFAVPGCRVRSRLSIGWPVEAAFTIPKNGRLRTKA